MTRRKIEKQFFGEVGGFSGPIVGLRDYTQKSGIDGYSIITMLVY